jgi:amino acid adenylation domain-containing protein
MSLSDRLERLTPEQRALLGAMLAAKTALPAAISRIPQRTPSDPRPLSFGQERFWFLDRVSADGALYTFGAHFHVAGFVDARALERSLSEVLTRHEVLRTPITEQRGEPALAAPSLDEFRLEEIRLDSLPPEERAAAAAQCVARESRHVFDLGRDPLLRGTLVRLGDAEHVLLLTVHHIAADGWSMGVLAREISELYRAFTNDRPSPLPRLPIQYADFAAWERSRLTPEALRGPLAYFRARLAGAPPVLDLAHDRPRPAVRSLRSGHARFEIEGPLHEAVLALGKALGATSFMTLVTAFMVVLHRYASQDDIVVGTPVAGRAHTDVEALIGLFINVLPLRADLSGDPSFAEMVGRVRALAIDLFAHQDVPFARLVEELRPARGAGAAPIFQVMFVLQSAAFDTLVLDGADVTPLPFDNGTIDLDLALEIVETARGLTGTLRYDAELFDAATAEQLVLHYRAILEAAVADAATPISRLGMLSPAERETVLVAWNRTAAAFPEHVRLDAMVRARAALTPDAVAVCCAGEVVTYGALVARAERIAHRLVELGAGPGALCAIYVDRSADMVAALLGVLFSGAGYVPLDPGYPRERTAFVLADAAARPGQASEGGPLVVLSEAHLAATLPPGDAKVLLLDEIASDADRSLATPDRAGSAEAVAYVIYTSGSTGRPKGVAVTHRNVVNLLCHMAGRLALDADDVLVAVTTLSFDIAGLELWLPLVTGARIELCDRRTAADGAALRALLERSSATLMQATPATWRLLLEAGWRGGPKFKALCGGEALPQDLADALLRRAGRAYNLYGPTETTIWSTVHELDGGPVRIGRPIANTQIYVLDRHLEPTPPSVPGEIYIGGAGVALGYHDRPELTRERFVPDPFRARSDPDPSHGPRMYRTGDRGRFRADGTLEHLGRLDDQLKIRGFRIEPGEIEATLCKLPGVLEAAVVPREHGPGDVRLCAYVVVDAARGAGAPELRRALEAALPAHMVPSAFIVVERLPRTPNGKLDRRALATEREAPRAVAEQVAAATPFEQQLAEIWAQVLGVATVSVTDDFFDLGGHSLLAMRVVSRVRDAFKLDLSLQTFFRAPTVRALAQRLEIARAPANEPPLVPRGDVEPALSFAQERFWFLERFEPGTALYHVPAVVRLRHRLALDVLHRALDAVVERHEVLRTTLVSTDDGRAPRVQPPRAVPVVVVRAHHLTAPQATTLLEGHAREPFDLAADLMVRVTIVELADDDRVVLFLFHHIAVDGWSVGVFFRELSAFYAAFAAGTSSFALPPLPIQHADFAAWQRRALAGGALDAQLAYWKSELDGAPRLLDLPLDLPRPPIKSGRGATISAELPAELVASLHALSRQANATLFVTLLAALQVLLSRLSGQRDVVVGTPVAGRGRLETEGLIGPFVNTLVIRGDLTGSPSFLELCARVREAMLAAYAHHDAPFERLVEELAPARDTSHSPLFQVMLALENAEPTALSLPGVEVTAVEIDTGVAKFDLTLWAREHASGLCLRLEYNTDVFLAESAARMLEQLGLMLRDATRHPGVAIDDLSPSIPTRGVHAPSAHGAPASSRGGPSGDPTAASEARHVGAGNALEKALVDLWEEILCVRPVGVRDDFFALGGHSLLAARLFDRIERRMGKRLPIAILFQAPTIEKLAEVMCREGWTASWSSLVAVQPGGSRPPFFCVHAVGGNILNYELLSRYLGPEQPFYALQSRGLDGRHAPHDSVHDAAAHYLQELRAVQPRGPYHLGGSSSGGIVAFEMAQQLVAQGETAGLVVFIDTQLLSRVPGPSRLREPAREIATRVDWHLGQLLLKAPEEWPAYLLERARHKARALLGRAEPAAPTPLLREVYARNRRALEAYVPRVYPGQITMLLSEAEPFRAFHDLRLEWSRYAAGGLVVRFVPGAHEHVLDEPNVAAVAAELESLLRRASRG